MGPARNTTNNDDIARPSLEASDPSIKHNTTSTTPPSIMGIDSTTTTILDKNNIMVGPVTCHYQCEVAPVYCNNNDVFIHDMMDNKGES